MIRIAICDDEERAVASTEKIVKTCLQAQGIGCEITTYTQSRNLLYDITDDGFFYDLILLDIEMPGISGMEIPQQVKGFLPNARIIFVTSHTEYAIDAFELSIFRYVPKNNLETKLTAAITDAAKLIELEAGQEYTIQTANHMEKIPYKDIFYIQRDGKNSSIVSSVGTSKVRKSLQRVFDELNAPEFIFIDRGYIVNIVQIMKVSDSIAILGSQATNQSILGGAYMMDWVRVVSCLFTNELRLFLGVYLVARLTDFSLERKALLLTGAGGCLATILQAASLPTIGVMAVEVLVITAVAWYYQRKKMNYKIALLAYLFDCVVVFFDLFSGKDHPLLCWIVPPPKDLC